jgi:uncharacterized membrane protein YdjX (TVP38/TMEM64 family)
MVAIKPIPTQSGKEPGRSGFPMADFIKIAAIVLLAFASGYLAWTHGEWFRDPRQIKAEVLQLGIWGPIGFMILYAVGPSLLVPGAIMTLAAGLAFGAFWGSIYAVAGAYMGALIAFGVGRMLGKQFVERIIGDRFEKLLDRIARNGFHIILYLRFFPIIPYNALNLLAGASPISFRDYFWASAIGLIPGTILFAFLGNEMWHPTSPRFVLALALIGLCFAAGEFYRRRRPADVGEI